MVGGAAGRPRDEANKVVIGVGLGKFSTKARLPSLHTSFQSYFVQKARSLGHIAVGVDEYYTSKKCPTCERFFGEVEIRRLYCKTCKTYMYQDVMAGHNICNAVCGHLMRQRHPLHLQPVGAEGNYVWEQAATPQTAASTGTSTGTSGQQGARSRKRAASEGGPAARLCLGESNCLNPKLCVSASTLNMIVQSNRQQQQQRALAARAANNGPAIKRQIEKPEPQPIPGTYTDYKLVSTSRDVLHHIMRFHGTKEVNPATFTAPVKLHRKRNENSYHYRGYYNKYNNQNSANNNNSNTAGSNIRDLSGDVKKEGAGVGGGASTSAAGTVPPTTGADTTLIAPYGGGVRNKQMLFKKRTRQIYIANEEERKKKEIEAAPWVVEDYDNQNNWTGQLEGGQGANYVIFVFSDDGFKVVPADKWYKFSSKLQYATLTAEEAEEQYQKSQKQSNSIRWLMRSKNKAKTEDGEEGAEEDVEREQLVTVDHEDDVGYDEDEARERKRMRGKHGDVDEMDFDEVWQDDEEMPSEMPGFEEDDKDDPRKKHGPSMDSDEDEDEEDTKGRLNDAGKAMKKALRKLEKNKVYESDDDKDPYASDQGSSDSDLDEIDKEKDVKKEDELTGLSQDGSKTKGKAKVNAKGAPLINKKSNMVKPSSTKPVSAKAMKTKTPLPTSRNASAGAQTNSKSSSSTVKIGSSTSQRAHSPTPAVAGGVSSGSSEKKRKLIDSNGGEGSGDIPMKKHARASISQSSSSTSTSQASSSASASQAPNNDSWLITEAEIVSYLKSRKEVTTRDLILSLKDKLRRDPRNKNLMATLTKKVAVPTNGILVLKPGY